MLLNSKDYEVLKRSTVEVEKGKFEIKNGISENDKKHLIAMNELSETAGNGKMIYGLDD